MKAAQQTTQNLASNRNRKAKFVSIGAFAIVVGMASVVPSGAQTGGPQVSPGPVPQLAQPVGHRSANIAVGEQKLLRIEGARAVLIAAPIDGNRGPRTLQGIAGLRKASETLQRYGVEVSEFFTPNNDWSQIKAAIQGAHFLVYVGHGVYDGETPPGLVGGFMLDNKQYVSPDEVRSLQPAPGAVAIIGGCFTAGNAGYDIGQIDQREANRRVAMYSAPFLEAGFGGYFANWYDDVAGSLAHFLFTGQSYGETYRSFHDYDAARTELMTHPHASGAALWVGHDLRDEGLAFNYAFAGNAELDFEQAFSARVIEGEGPRLSRAEREELAFRARVELGRENLDKVVHLIQSGADPNFSRDDWSLLCVAANGGHLNVVQALVEAGANVNQSVAGTAWSPLRLAQSRGHAQVAEYLRSKGAVAARAISIDGPPDAPKVDAE